ncbi:DUF5667 domain-containing protein [Chloroflexota bacterium]
MKFKKFRLILIGCIIATSLVFGGTASAQDEELPDPGITPDSPLYFLDNWGKKIGLFLAFGPEAKAGKALAYAEERLAEAQVMATKNRVRETTRAANDYDGFMAMVTTRTEEARRQGASDNLTEIVALATSKHLSVLDGIKDRVPEEAKGAIARARTASMNGQINALRALAKEKPERALDINQAAIERRLNRALVKASENVTAEVDEALDDATELAEIEEEISKIAQRQGKDISTIEERIARATSNRLEVLARVYGKVPEQAKPAIERAIENSARKYERTVEALKKKNALGEIPEEAPALRKIREEVKEKLKLRTSKESPQVSDNNTDKPTAQVRPQAGVGERVREQTTNIKPETTESALPENKVKEEKEEAQEAIREAEEELAKIRAKAEREGVTLTANAFAKFNSLLAKAKTALAAVNYKEAEELAEQAEEALEDIEETIEKLKNETEEKEDTGRVRSKNP